MLQILLHPTLKVQLAGYPLLSLTFAVITLYCVPKVHLPFASCVVYLPLLGIIMAKQYILRCGEWAT